MKLEKQSHKLHLRWFSCARKRQTYLDYICSDPDHGPGPSAWALHATVSVPSGRPPFTSTVTAPTCFDQRTLRSTKAHGVMDMTYSCGGSALRPRRERISQDGTDGRSARAKTYAGIATPRMHRQPDSVVVLATTHQLMGERGMDAQVIV